MGHGFDALSTALAGFGLTWLFQSWVLLALGLLAGRALKKVGPAVQSGVYRTTLAAVLVCPVASAVLTAAGFDGFSLRLPAPASEAPAQVGPPVSHPPVVPHAVAHAPESRALPTPMPVALPRPEAPGGAVSVSAPAAAPAPFRRPLTRAGIAMVGLAAWGLGSMIMLLRLWVGQRRMRRLRASAVPAEPCAEALCREIAVGMGLDAPTVWRSPFLFSPCLDGLRRPAVLLPDDVDENLRETLIHELAHLGRWDCLWNLLRRLAAAALWVQPLLWMLSRRIEMTAEEVCDDYVVHFGADRARYAGHLLDLAGRALPPLAPSGVGMVSLRSMLARRIVRILDTSRSLSTRAGTWAVVAMLAVGIAGTVLAGLLGVGVGLRKADAQTAVKAAPDDETIRGQVVGPDGKPVAGATVIASRARLLSNGIGDDYNPRKRYETARQTAGQDGRFEFAFEAPELVSGVEVIATAPGFGLGYLLNGQPVSLRPGDRPIRGRIVDLEGRPVQGVLVRLGQVWVPAPGSARGSASTDKPSSTAEKLGLDAEPLLPDGVLTDADGRFRIEGLGEDVLAHLTISGPSVALKNVKVLTRPMKRAADEPRDPAFAGVDEPATHGADCTITVEPTRLIEGVVRDADTSEPIAGAVVTAAALSGSTLVIDGLISTETDARGHYRLAGLPKEGPEGHELAVYPPFDRPYFITRRIAVPARPGFDPVPFDIALKRGIWVVGTVTDVVTGKPVRAAVDYFPFLTNAHAKDYPNFDPNVSASVAIKTRYKTDAEGRFRVPGLPGRGVVTVHTDDKAYRTGVGAESIEGRTGQQQLLTYDRIFPALYQGLKEVNVPDGVDSVACDLGLDPGGSVRMRLVDDAGSPVTGASVWGRFPEGVDHGDHNLYDESLARVSGLVPGKPRTVLIQHRDRKIGAVLTIPPDGPRNDPEITITLRPSATLTGRLVDAKGKPAAGGVRVALVPGAATVFSGLPVASVEVDADGRFRCEGVPAGGPYQVTATNRLVYGLGPRMEPEAFKRFEIAKELEVEPGQAVALGVFDVNTGKRVDEVAAAPADVPITGRIVDLEGRPIAGVLVEAGSVLVPAANDLTPWLDGVKKGEAPWIAVRHVEWKERAPAPATREAKTDKDGRFRLEGFGPDRVVDLKLKSDAIALTTIDVVTRKMSSFPARGFQNNHGAGTQTIFGADFTYTAAPSRPVEGVVRDATTGQPLAGAEVRSYRFAGSDFVGTMDLRTKTDAEGRFRLTGLPKGKGNALIVVPNDEQPYFLQEVALGDSPGAGPVKLRIALQRGVWIEGRVTEEASGKPVEGAWLHYMPFLENTFAQVHPVFDKDGNTNGVGVQDRYKTKADGTFRLVGLPGRAIVGAVVHGKAYLQGVGSEAIKGMNKNGHFETYRNPINPGKLWPTVMKEINPAADADVVRLDLRVTTGPSVRFKVVDGDGKPVLGAKTQGRAGRSSYDREDMAKAEGDVTNLMSGEERMLVVRHESRKLGKVVRVRKGDDAQGPVLVTLEPLATITGRVVDANGNPVSGASVRSDLLPSGDFGLSLGQVSTDEGGRFRVSDVPTGCAYALLVESAESIAKRRVVFSNKDIVVKPGKTTEVDELRFKND